MNSNWSKAPQREVREGIEEPVKTQKTQGLGVGGVEIYRSRSIVVNHFLQTSQLHIFAARDMTNQPLYLEITAWQEGTFAAENALTDAQEGIDYSTVPYTIFTDLELPAWA